MNRSSHRVLGVPNTATVHQIKSAYRKLSMVHHPDRGGCPKKFMEITTAYKALTHKTVPAWLPYVPVDHVDKVNSTISKLILAECVHMPYVIPQDGRTYIVAMREWCRGDICNARLQFTNTKDMSDGDVVIVIL